MGTSAHIATAVVLALAVAACSSRSGNVESGPRDLSRPDPALCSEADLEADADQDGIRNGLERCREPGADTDHDGIPDWQDWDSDGDGLPDRVEKGPRDAAGACADASAGGWPCDHDGDGLADYRDLDSDNDQLSDADEDRNGDGQVGCCLARCGEPDAAWQAASCTLGEEGCGPGQACSAGACVPRLAFSCSGGETSPTRADSFGDGLADSLRGTLICRDATKERPHGRGVPQLRQSQAGDWTVALEQTSRYAELAVASALPGEAAAVFDDDAPGVEVAGFVVSRPTEKASAEDLAKQVLEALRARLPGGPGKMGVRISGIEGRSHDLFPSVQGMVLDLSLSTPATPARVRDDVIAALLDRSLGQLGNLPPPFGPIDAELVIRLTTVRRFAFAKDASGKIALDGDGYPLDDGDKSKWRVLVMGAVARRAAHQDPARRTGIVVDDLANGTALARSGATVADECEGATVKQIPVADIIWVIDESDSMVSDRQDVVANAKDFFSRATASGLDFRMCVTGVCKPGMLSTCTQEIVGTCCSSADEDPCDSGGPDRFLLSSEPDLFAACVKNPPGCEKTYEDGLTNLMAAVKRHLPRTPGVANRIRPEASLALIVISDEAPQELKTAGIISSSPDICEQLTPAKQAGVESYLEPWLDLLSGATNPEAAATVHLIAGVCSYLCPAEPPFGYEVLTRKLGGHQGDICQSNLGSTLQAIIDSIVGTASPLKLEHVPISSTLAVAKDGTELERSRGTGFDYQSASNSLVLINTKYQPGSRVVCAYHRWTQTTPR